MEQYIKKPAIDLTELAIGIIVLGIVVSIGATVLITQRDSRLTELNVISTGNETTPATDGGDNLANIWVKNIGTVTNSTGGETIPTNNYTTAIDSFGTGTVTFDGTSAYNSSNVNVSYTWYNTSRADFDLANKAAIGLGEYGNWFKIIVIVGVAALVLSLIFLAFGNRSAAGEGQVGISY
ncbi:MAG TPA: hypothetical protein ENH46_02585 [Candidatus Pacearchaeota archaeon]|nr:hypothetical protein [Candidatus Pacearchaeota archaeon]